MEGRGWEAGWQGLCVAGVPGAVAAGMSGFDVIALMDGLLIIFHSCPHKRQIRGKLITFEETPGPGTRQAGSR